MNRLKLMFTVLSGQRDPEGADWTCVAHLKKMTTMKFLIKGIDTGDNVRLAWNTCRPSHRHQPRRTRRQKRGAEPRASSTK